MFKRLFVMMLVGAAAFAAWHATHPQPVAADDATANADAPAPVDNSFIGRLEGKIGQITASIAGNQIRASVAKTERQIAILQPLVRKTGGSSGKNAITVTNRIWTLDSLSLASLDAAHPVDAIKKAMDARGYIDMVRMDVSDESAAR
jgi:hypothetical protein